MKHGVRVRSFSSGRIETCFVWTSIMKKLTVIFSLIILSSFVGYIFIYKPHADQMRLESVVVNLEVADDGLREQMITDLKDIAESGNAVAQYRYAELLLRDGNVSEALPYLENLLIKGS